MKRKTITDFLITAYCIDKFRYDFMGFILQEGDVFTLHHIEPTSCGGKDTVANSSILCGGTSHPYIHVIQRYSPELFKLISEQIRIMKAKRYIDPVNLAIINELLNEFEDKFSDERTNRGNLIIRPEFKVRIQKNNLQ